VPVAVAIAIAAMFAFLPSPLERGLLCSPLELAAAALAAALAWTAMAIVREEERMSAKGEMLVPRRWRRGRRASPRVNPGTACFPPGTS